MLRDMTLQRLDNVGVVVNDLAAAVAFFKELSLEFYALLERPFQSCYTCTTPR